MTARERIEQISEQPVYVPTIVRMLGIADELAHDGSIPASAFLHWIADRLVHVYGESDNTDFILRLRDIAALLTHVEAIAAPTPPGVGGEASEPPPTPGVTTAKADV